MSIIFQLFNAENLKNLSNEQLDQLLDSIIHKVDDSTNNVLRASMASAKQIENELRKNPPPDYAAEVIDMLRKRAHEVFQQLISQPSSNQPGPFNRAASMFDQLLSAEDFERLNLDTQLSGARRKILLWAITCELDNLNSYRTLQRIQEEARTEIHDPKQTVDQVEGQQRFKDPDSVYSPFNPRSPVYYRDHP
jgi:hypothetical protein